MTIKLIEVEVVSREDQGLGIAILDLKSADGKMLPKFEAGSHIDVHIGQNIIRQYSLSNDPLDTSVYRLGVLKDPRSRGGSELLHQEFVVGKRLKISEPRNHFPLNFTAMHTVLAGGGIGITPMIAMAYSLKEKGKSFELHYCTRSKGAGAFEKELAEKFSGQVFFHYDDGDKSQLFSPQEILKGEGMHVYVCGPTGFMDWLIDSAKKLGIPSKNIHFEYFSADVDASGDAFEVYCAKSDITVSVMEGQSIVKALAVAGVKVDVSCEEGVCGTCITDVLDGDPDHRDHFLTDEEKADNDQMALCCSRSKSKRLVLDI